MENFKEYIDKCLSERDCEKINDKLEKIFNSTSLKTYISKIHPDIYPEHVGLYYNLDGKFVWGLWFYQHYYDDWTEKGWNFYESPKTQNYINDVKEYFKENDKKFYEFLETI